MNLYTFLLLAESWDIPSILGSIGIGGIIGAMFVFLIKNRTQSSSEYVYLLNERKNQIEELKQRISVLEERELDNSNRILNLSTQLIMFESSHNDLPIPFWIKDNLSVVRYLNPSYEKQILIDKGYLLKDYLNSDDAEMWGKDIGNVYMQGDRKVIKAKKALVSIEPLVSTEYDSYYGLVIKFPRLYNKSVIGVAGLILIKSHNKELLQTVIDECQII